MRVAAMVAATLLCGCNSILGIGDVHGGPDASGPGPDAAIPVCGVAPANTVVGCARITHVSPDNSTAVTNLDLSKLTIKALIYDPSTMTFATAPGTGTSDGTLTIPNVPDGASYYLEILDPSATFTGYFFTDQRSLDLGYTELGRDTPTTTQDTEVTIDLSGMTPWRALDLVYIDGYSGGTEKTWQISSPTPPADDATTFDETFNWQTAATGSPGFAIGFASPPPIVLDMAGDDLTISHVQDSSTADVSGNTFEVRTVVDRFRKTSIGMTDGSPVTISGALAPALASGHSMQISADVSALAAASHDAGTETYQRIACYRMAAPGSDGLVLDAGNPAAATSGGAPLLAVQGNVPPTLTSLSFPSLAYAPPALPEWQQFVECVLSRQRSSQPPGATHALSSSEWIQTFTTAGTSYQFVPTVGTVDHVEINGVAALVGGPVPFDGTKALSLSWDAVPNATGYYALLYHVLVDAGGNPSQSTVATFHTKDTSLAIPASVLTKGDSYFFRISAVSSPIDYAAGHLAEVGFPNSDSRVATGIFELGTSCGNGVKDPGEACDTAGDSATCNADCTLPVCGDYHTNTFTGEQCDNGALKDTPECDSTCKRPVCGDGHWNQVAGEQCDDGNPNDGDGCSHACKLEHCGDGVHQTFEACDDGNNVPGDGCGPLCQVENGWSCTLDSPSMCTRI